MFTTVIQPYNIIHRAFMATRAAGRLRRFMTTAPQSAVVHSKDAGDTEDDEGHERQDWVVKEAMRGTVAFQLR